MTHPKNDVERLRLLEDALEEMLISAPDEAVLEEVRLQGIDPAAAAAAVTRLIEAQIKLSRQSALHAARDGYLRVSESINRGLIIPATTEERRGLLQRILSRTAAMPVGLTLAFREGKDLSDEDVASMLADFADLGLLNDESQQ
jgi:hypothetical protein